MCSKLVSSPRLLIIGLFGLGIGLLSVFMFRTKHPVEEDFFYLNHSDTVDYVGLSTCASCHEDIAKSFLHTGMGSSFNKATPKKSAADFLGNHVIYDTINDLYYHPYWVNSELFIKEYRLLGTDTLHQRIEKIDYIIGSGQHTNSHLIERNGFIFQAPFTWYSQQKHWGLPPGFQRGRNSRFTRIIDEECMSCHNSMPKVEDKSDNKFTKVGLGIDCERCHGPGELHVNLRLKGKTIKSKEGVDRTIVNPSKLSWQKQVDLCQRCHLQGNAVLEKGKHFTQFKPGMKLSDYYSVFMPKYENMGASMIMASHAQRLQLSACFIKSNKNSESLNLTCISCHNPHISVKVTGVERFNAACKSCHAKKDACSADMKLREKKADNCVTCHMPKSGTEDIPHVSIHDHYIRKPVKKLDAVSGQLKGLYCINNDNPTRETTIKAYLSYYEKFDPKVLFLNEARKLLDKKVNIPLEIHYWYLKGEHNKVIKFSKKGNLKNMEAWDLYRIGQSYLNINQWALAEKFLELAINLSPTNFEFLYKLSIAKHNLDKFFEEEQILKSVIQLNANHTNALNSLGYRYFKVGELPKAIAYYKRCLSVNPDFLPVLKNLFDYYNTTGNAVKAKEMASRILQKEPNNGVLKSFLSNL